MKRRGRGAARAAAGVVGLALVVTGCVSVPTSGRVPASWLQGSGGLAQQAEHVVPLPPGRHWSAVQIVQGFLAASGSSLPVARQYLTSKFRWKPGRPTILADTPSYSNAPLTGRIMVPGSPAVTSVVVSSEHVETLTAGNIVVSSGSQSFRFDVAQVHGQFRISGIFVGGKAVNSLLLVSLADFGSSYQPRDLYYFPANGTSQVAAKTSVTLIPDPVYIKNAALQAGASQLVRDLLKAPAGWLGGAASTAFPEGTKLLGVEVSGVRAVIDLGGAAARAGPLEREQMMAQIVWSLTSSPYASSSTTQISSVALQINHRPVVLHRNQKILLGLRSSFQSWVPGIPAESLYFQVATNADLPPAIRVRKVGASNASALNLPAAIGPGAFSAIAVSPVNQRYQSVAGCRGKNVYVSLATRASRVVVPVLPANCTSLSWDDYGDLWVTAGPQVYLLKADPATGLVSKQITPVVNPALTGSTPVTLTSLRVAPDGVRVAMIVRTKTGSRVIMVAISRGVKSSPVYLAQSTQMVTVGSGVTSATPVALTWWDPDHLLVLYKPSYGASQLYEVPLNGGPSRQVPTPRDAVSVAAAGSRLVVGTSSVAEGGWGPIFGYTQHLNGPWQQLGIGNMPAYPG